MGFFGNKWHAAKRTASRLFSGVTDQLIHQRQTGKPERKPLTRRYDNVSARQPRKGQIDYVNREGQTAFTDTGSSVRVSKTASQNELEIALTHALASGGTVRVSGSPEFMQRVADAAIATRYQDHVRGIPPEVMREAQERAQRIVQAKVEKQAKAQSQPELKQPEIKQEVTQQPAHDAAQAEAKANAGRFPKTVYVGDVPSFEGLWMNRTGDLFTDKSATVETTVVNNNGGSLRVKNADLFAQRLSVVGGVYQNGRYLNSKEAAAHIKAQGAHKTQVLRPAPEPKTQRAIQRRQEKTAAVDVDHLRLQEARNEARKLDLAQNTNRHADTLRQENKHRDERKIDRARANDAVLHTAKSEMDAALIHCAGITNPRERLQAQLNAREQFCETKRQVCLAGAANAEVATERTAYQHLAEDAGEEKLKICQARDEWESKGMLLAPENARQVRAEAGFPETENQLLHNADHAHQRGEHAEKIRTGCVAEREQMAKSTVQHQAENEYADHGIE